MSILISLVMLFSSVGECENSRFAHDSFTFPIIYKAIWSLGCRIENGEMVHCVAMQMGFGQDVYFGNSMLEVYVKYESIGNTSKLFDAMTHRDLVLSHFRSLSLFFSFFFLCF